MSKVPKVFVPDLFNGCATPCAKCPYRKDAPLALWSADEFKQLLATEDDLLGATYGCHNNDGTVCRGWFIDQRERGFPSIALRMTLATRNIDADAIDRITAPEGVELFSDIYTMSKANFPTIRFRKPKSKGHYRRPKAKTAK
jgi:hypothetical protein